MKTNSIFVAIFCVLLNSCAGIRSQHEPTPNGVTSVGPEMRDVPSQARSKDLGPRKRILVLPFIEATGLNHPPQVLKNAREILVRELTRTDQFVVVANSDFPRDVSGFVKNSEYDLEEMAKLAQGIGIAGVLEARILEVKSKRSGDEVGLVREVRESLTVTVQFRMLASKTGHIVLNETRQALIDDSAVQYADRGTKNKEHIDDPFLLQAGIAKASTALISKFSSSLEKMSWEGRVALVKGERVYLNAGRLSGLQVGDILKVMEDGEDVFDPETGALIGKVPGRVKGTLEVVSYFGRDGSIGVLHSGGGFKENDLVELY